MTRPNAQIRDDVVFGKDVRLAGFCNLYGCTIGDESMIGPFVEIQCDVQVGRRVKIQSHSFLCSGVRVEDEVFIGHGVMFINDRFPRSTRIDGQSKRGGDWVCEPTVVRRRASIGSNATILCGITIGEGAVIGAGSVVTRDVPPSTVVAGNPARVLRRITPEDEGVAAPGTMSAPAAVPFLDLPRLHAPLKAELMAVAERAIDEAAFVGGSAVEQFEREFAQFTGSQHCVGVASGTDALRFALLALGVGPGTSVITVPNTFVATAASITQAGGAIEFVDVDPNTCLMDPGILEDYLKRRFATLTSGPRPAVVLPVHLYGQCADMDAIVSIAHRFGLKVLEDAAQAHGSRYRGRPAGALGDAAAFSFYPGKNLGACGEGGAVTCNDADVYQGVLLRRDHGRSGRYVHVVEGYNGRLHSLQAGMLSVKLKHLERWNAQRRRVAAGYDAVFGTRIGLRPVTVQPWNQSCYHLYVIRSPQRERLREFLQNQSIATGIHYPVALHRQPCYERLGLPLGAFPHTERCCDEVLSLPMCPTLEPEQQQRVIDVLCAFANSGRQAKSA